MTTSIFAGVPPNPTDQAIYLGAEMFRDAGCDSIVAIGGNFDRAIVEYPAFHRRA